MEDYLVAWWKCFCIYRYVSNRVSIYHFLTCLYTIFDYQGFLQKLEGLFSLLIKNFTKSLLYKSFGSNIFIKKFSKYCISDLHIQPEFNKHNHIFYCTMYIVNCIFSWNRLRYLYQKNCWCTMKYCIRHIFRGGFISRISRVGWYSRIQQTRENKFTSDPDPTNATCVYAILKLTQKKFETSGLIDYISLNFLFSALKLVS